MSGDDDIYLDDELEDETDGNEIDPEKIEPGMDDFSEEEEEE